MKSKFFVSILFVLVVAMVLTLYATTLFINDERLRLIDEQIEQTTSTLLAAQLDKEVIEDIDQFDFLLAEKLQFEPPNMFLTLFDKERKIIYQNYLARYHQLKPSSQLGWNSFLYNSHHLRSFTLDIKNGKEFLEVGLVLNRTNEIWGQSSLRLFGYIILIFLAAAAISYFLTQYLLKSLKQVSTYLTYLASNLQQINQADKKPIRSDFFNEFNQLILSVEKLKKKLELLVSDRRLFVAQMTHELKTPLAIILNQLELLPEEVKQTNAYKNIDAEIGQLSHTIQEFLEWTSVDKIPVEILETDATKIGELTNQIVDRLSAEEKNRIQIEDTENFYVFAKSTLLRQTLSNLITNALKYSSEAITIEILQSSWIIHDTGRGIPESVMKRLGQPFNRFSSNDRKSTGLGLAWVFTICQKYHWTISVDSKESGTRVQIAFPQEAAG